MSEPRVAALVCEGQTDIPILRAFLQAIWPELEEVRCLQPELDETDRAKGPAGWTQVRAWCEAHKDDLEDVLDPDIGGPIDLLVVAMDVDVAVAAGIENPPASGAGSYETTRLRSTMASWLKRRSRLPPSVILSTPVRAIEAWIIAALFPKESAVERIHDPAHWLVQKKKLRESTHDRRPWKEIHRYRDEFAPAVAKRMKGVRGACPEAERTARAVEERRSAIGQDQ